MSQYPRVATLLASATRVTAVANSGAAGVDCARAKRIACLLDVTAMAGAVGDTLDVFIDMLAPDGTTWLNAGHFAQVAGNAAAVKHYLVLDSASVAATSFNVTADCAAGVTKPYLFGSQIRARHTLVDAGAHGQSATFSVSAFLQ
jgi:hypothetical protein